MREPETSNEMSGEINRLTERVAALEEAFDERDRLLAAIRRHRDYRGDDRCHLDDGELYAALPEGDTRPARDTAVTLENCERYIRCRQQGREYVSPEREIDRLRSRLAALEAAAKFAREVLDALAFRLRLRRGDSERQCPVCGAGDKDEHFGSCRLVGALAALDAVLGARKEGADDAQPG